VRIFNNSDQRDFRRSLRNEPTYAERALWYGLRKNGVGAKFRRQESIGRYVVDFYCPELRLAVEVDGDTHNGREAYDRHRDTELAAVGVEVMRFTDGEISSLPDLVLERIRLRVEQLRAEGKSVRSPSSQNFRSSH
jgi:very-short-patch-repair endonuclease